MTKIAVILSDSTEDRPCLGLALEIEERIQSHRHSSSTLIDLRDFENDHESLRQSLQVDGIIFVVQEENWAFPDCVSKMIGDTYPLLKNMPTGIVINSEDEIWSESVGARLQKILLVQDFILFHQKLALNKIQHAFNSSYELTDQDFEKKLAQFIGEYLSFIGTWVPKSNEILAETI